jgi:hypothetical protein
VKSALWGRQGPHRRAVRRGGRLDRLAQARIPFAAALDGCVPELLRPAAQDLAALKPDAQEELRDDLLDLIERLSRAKDGTVVMPSEYLEVTIVKR